MNIDDLLNEESFISKILNKFLEFSLNDKNNKKVLFQNFIGHSEKDYPLLEGLAKSICLIMENDIDEYIKSYFWMIDIFREELFYFVKTKKYRRNTFEESYKEIYKNEPYMRRYIKGLLISQIIWSNHAKSYINFQKFINEKKDDFSYLEIGPGHGLFAAKAAESKKCKSVETWDISPESNRQTKASLDKISKTNKIKILKKDIVKNTKNDLNKEYDIIIMSEILEHLENPQLALKNAYNFLSKNGIIYINFPINSPAPDHIFLLKNTNEVNQLIKDAGFSIVSADYFPASGYSIERAIKLNATISCNITAKMLVEVPL